MDAIDPGQGWSSSSGSRSGGLARTGRGGRQGEEAALVQPSGWAMGRSEIGEEMGDGHRQEGGAHRDM